MNGPLGLPRPCCTYRVRASRIYHGSFHIQADAIEHSDDPNTQRQTPILFNTDATFDVLSTIEAIHSGAQTDPEGWLGPLADLLAARTASASPDGGSASAISAPAPAPAPVNVTGRGNAKRYEAAWEKLEAVRLACARNLAATMVYDLDHPGLQLGPGINGAGQGEGTAGRVFGQLGFA